MRIILAVIAALMVAACETPPPPAGPGLGDIQLGCKAGNQPFVQSWPCVRSGLAMATDYHPDVTAVYIAKGDLTAAEVQAGRMTDAEAKLKMAEARQTAFETVDKRERIAARSPVSAADAVVISTMLNRPTQQPMPRPTNCMWMGTVWTCS